MAGGMTRVQPAKEYLVIYEGMTTKKHEYLLAADLSLAMAGAQEAANKRGLVVQAVAEVQWRRES